ncbi:MAG: insulinase family protein [Ignavibacteria bacterium]
MKYSKCYFLKTILLLLTVAVTTHIFATDKKSERTLSPKIKTLPKGVSIYQLDNGLQVLFIEDPALPVIGTNVIVKTGSAYESFSASGMSHLLEHLLSNGTASRNQKQLYDDVDRIGGYNNATTRDFFTDYMFVVSVENAKKGLEIQADMIFNSTFPVDKFQKEKGIVLEEISKDLADPDEQLERNTISILYKGHALSIPALGTYSTIESLTRDDVFSFYENNYVPNNIILTVIGNFQTTAFLPLIKEIYGRVHPREVPHDENSEWKTGFQYLNAEPAAKGTVYHRFYDGKEKVLQLYYPLPLNKSSEYYDLLNIALGKNKDLLSSALQSQYPQIKNIELLARVSHLSNYLEAKVTFTADSDYDNIAKSLSAQVSKFTFHLPAEVIEAEAIKMRTEFAMNIEKPQMFGIYYSDVIVKGGIEALLASSGGDGYFPAAKELELLKIPELQFVIIQAPAAIVEKEKVVSSTVTKYFQDTTTGKNLIVVQNEMNNLLAVHYLVKHKAVYESKYGKDASKILHDAIKQRLTSDKNKKNSGKYGFMFTVNDNPFIPMDDIYLHPDFGYIRAEGLADDVNGAVHYLNSQLKDFVPTEDEFKKATEKYRNPGHHASAGDEGKKIFGETYKSVVYEPNPYLQYSQELTYEKLTAFAKEYLNPSNIIISVVSPADTDTVNAAFEGYGFSKIKDEPPVFVPALRLQSKPVTIEKLHGGERSYLFWGFQKQIDTKDTPALHALSLILNEQIVFDIREKQGLAYDINAGIEVMNDRALFFISQGTRPKNVDTLVAQYPGFFKNSVIDSLTQEHLDKSINQYFGRIIFRRLSSINKAFYLGSSLYLNNDHEYDKKYLDELKKLKMPDIKSATQKYLNVTNPVSIIIR